MTLQYLETVRDFKFMYDPPAMVLYWTIYIVVENEEEALSGLVVNKFGV